MSVQLGKRLLTVNHPVLCLHCNWRSRRLNEIAEGIFFMSGGLYLSPVFCDNINIRLLCTTLGVCSFFHPPSDQTLLLPPGAQYWPQHLVRSEILAKVGQSYLPPSMWLSCVPFDLYNLNIHNYSLKMFLSPRSESEKLPRHSWLVLLNPPGLLWLLGTPAVHGRLAPSPASCACWYTLAPSVQMRPILLCLAIGKSRHAWETLKTPSPLHPQVYQSSISSRRPRGWVSGKRPASSARLKESRPLSLPGRKTKPPSHRRPGETLGFLLSGQWSEGRQWGSRVFWILFFSAEVEATQKTCCLPTQSLLNCMRVEKKKWEKVFQVVLSFLFACVGKITVWQHFTLNISSLQ